MTVRNPLVRIDGKIEDLPASDSIGGAAQGPAGLTWLGAWDSATAYAVDDAVSDGGSSYICITAHTNHEPPNATYWELLAEKGDTGATGATGASGATGAAGADGVGVPAGGTSGQVLAKASGTDYDTGWVDQSGGGGSGAWTSVETHTASASAALDFTTGITSTYKQFQLVLDGFVPATDTVDLYLLFSTDGGTTWLSTGYKWTISRVSSDTGNIASVSDGAAQCQLATTNSASVWSNGAGQSLSATLTLYNLNSASLYKYYSGQVVFIYTTGLLMTMQVGGSQHTATAINAIRLKASSGNIASGTATLYGR